MSTAIKMMVEEHATAQKILDNVNACIAELEEAGKPGGKWDCYRMQYKGWAGNAKVFRMTAVYDELSIFDWWKETLSMSQLKQMQSFLKTAIKLGYTGYVCFKVGATGCSNGMWAYKQLSTDGYSPDGECLYRTFTPAYLGWDACLADGSWVSDREDILTDCTDTPLKVVKQYI